MRSWRSQEGANALEFALVLPILIMLVFGAITFGIAFNRKLQMSHATREAVRYAATLPGAGATAWYEDVFERLVATAVGETPVTDATLSICVSVTTGSATGPSTASLTATGNAGHGDSDDMVASGTSGSSHCYADGLTGDRVQVVVRRNTTLDAVFFRRDVTLAADGVARYEDG